MKKLFSLVKATMTSDMNIFKIRQKKDNKKSNLGVAIFISLVFMFVMWSYANILFEQMAPLNLEVLVISLFTFVAAFMTIVEGIYKSGSLIFNCRDDQLLLSLPIKRSTVLFIRIFKFYVFEFIYHALLIIPLIIAYLRWAKVIEGTLFFTTFIMLFILPIIPIVISCFIGAISTSISSMFQYKKLVQTVLSMIILGIVFYLSFQMDDFLNYLVKHATSINDLVTKIYYPAGVYTNLIMNFNLKDLLVFTLENILLFALMIVVLGKFYFKINSRIKVVENKKSKRKELHIKTKSIMNSFVHKELLTFLNTPVFIINAGFGLFLFILMSFVMTIRFDSIIPILTDPKTINLSIDFINNYLSLFIFLLIAFTSFMTSITNSVISLEGRNINILKSLPISTKKILLAKIYSSMVLTTPVLLLGTIFLLLRFKISIIDSILLLGLSLLAPLISHFVGLIINLKFPKLDAENAAEVVKQSTSSFLAVMIGMVLVVLSAVFTMKLAGEISSTLILLLIFIFYLILDILLYSYLINYSVKDFDNLSI